MVKEQNFTITMDPIEECNFRDLCEGVSSVVNLTCNHRDDMNVTNVGLSTYQIVKLSITAIISIWSLIGNILVIAVVLCNQFLRTPMNYYLVNLAVADLLITVLCIVYII